MILFWRTTRSCHPRPRIGIVQGLFLLALCLAFSHLIVGALALLAAVWAIVALVSWVLRRIS